MNTQILIADHEVKMHQWYRSILEKGTGGTCPQQVSLHFFESPLALARFHHDAFSHGQQIALCIISLREDSQEGRQAARELRGIDPELPLLFTVPPAYANQLQQEREWGVILEKPLLAPTIQSLVLHSLQLREQQQMLIARRNTLEGLLETRPHRGGGGGYGFKKNRAGKPLCVCMHRCC